jgi:hypothetical protein
MQEWRWSLMEVPLDAASYSEHGILIRWDIEPVPVELSGFEWWTNQFSELEISTIGSKLVLLYQKIETVL